VERNDQLASQEEAPTGSQWTRRKRSHKHRHWPFPWQTQSKAINQRLSPGQGKIKPR